MANQKDISSIKNNIPISEKYMLTIYEASAYWNVIFNATDIFLISHITASYFMYNNLFVITYITQSSENSN